MFLDHLIIIVIIYIPITGAVTFLWRPGASNNNDKLTEIMNLKIN